jgi:hypothetical protein
MNRNDIPGTTFRGSIPFTTQASIERLHQFRKWPAARMTKAQIQAVYSEKMTCDVISPNGAVALNVPVRTEGGLVNNNANVWGRMKLPSIGQWVTIEFMDGKSSFPIITGMLLAYSVDVLQGSQTPPNSSHKQFTKKLLEASKSKTIKEITQSGTTLEIGEDGTTTIETPSGSFFQIDEANAKLTIEFRVSGTMKAQIILKDGEMDINTASGKILLNGNLEVDV